jgi:hypothetical protein
LVRDALSPEPRSGDSAKNSARLPDRRVLRSHSSAETTTPAVSRGAGGSSRSRRRRRAARPCSSDASNPTSIARHWRKCRIRHLRQSFSSVANDLGFTEATIGALMGHLRGTITGCYIHTVDSLLVMAADTVAGYIQCLPDGKKFQRTTDALDRALRRSRACSAICPIASIRSERGQRAASRVADQLADPNLCGSILEHGC